MAFNFSSTRLEIELATSFKLLPSKDAICWQASSKAMQLATKCISTLFIILNTYKSNPPGAGRGVRDSLGAIALIASIVAIVRNARDIVFHSTG